MSVRVCVYVERKRIFTRLWLYVSSQKSFKKITHVPFSLCTFFVASLLLRHVGVSLAVRPFVRPSIYLSGPFCSKGFCLVYLYVYVQLLQFGCLTLGMAKGCQPVWAWLGAKGREMSIWDIKNFSMFVIFFCLPVNI